MIGFFFFFLDKEDTQLLHIRLALVCCLFFFSSFFPGIFKIHILAVSRSVQCDHTGVKGGSRVYRIKKKKFSLSFLFFSLFSKSQNGECY